MKQGFPWVLAAQYLMAGVGSVIGVLSAALASISMREIQNVEPRNQNYVSVSMASSLRRKSSSNSAAAFELRKHSFRDNNTTTNAEALSSSNRGGVSTNAKTSLQGQPNPFYFERVTISKKC